MTGIAQHTKSKCELVRLDLACQVSILISCMSILGIPDPMEANHKRNLREDQFYEEIKNSYVKKISGQAKLSISLENQHS